VSHVMFYTHVKNGNDWDSGAVGSPVMSSPHWFFSSKGEHELHGEGLPPILVFLVAVPTWSDGSPVGQ